MVVAADAERNRRCGLFGRLLLLLLLLRRGLLQRLATGGELGLVVLVAHVGDVHPRVRHLVDGAIAPADPLFGSGLALFAAVLSCQAVIRRMVPFGSIGAASSA